VLYLLLRLTDRPVDYGRVKESLGEKGPYPSLLRLRETADEFGLDCATYRCSPSDLGKGPFPVVTLMNLHPEQGGEYVLLINYDGTSWQMIDGSTATLLSLSDDEFRRSWSGVVLAQRPARPPWATSLAVGLTALVTYVGFRAVVKRRGNATARPVVSLPVDPRHISLGGPHPPVN
jgi:ABC-type bacteriocin/lantibiotic exporter with double-glycine peptidase domain